MLDRRHAVRQLLLDRGDALVVSGLGSPTWDLAAAGDTDANFYLWGAMGGAVMIGLGLAIAQPARRVIVITGDGEMLMGMGSLATVALVAPDNLAIVVLDNARYGETGMQPSHTAGPTDLVAVAEACGIANVLDVSDDGALANARSTVTATPGPLFVRVSIATGDEPRVMPIRDGVELKERFRRAARIS